MTMGYVRMPVIKEVSLISLKSKLKGNANAETTYFPAWRLTSTIETKLNQRSTDSDGTVVFRISN